MKFFEITVPPGFEDDLGYIKKEIQVKFKLDDSLLENLRIVKRSLDARKQPKFLIRCTIESETDIVKYKISDVSKAKPVHIVGAGPAGLFAALKVISLGLKPIIIERGKDVKSRRKDLALLMKQGILNPDSNYCFGEGGAGTFSDGKLYTRSNKRGSVESVLETFINFGADPSIRVDAHPHIGTNKLPKIISAITNYIRECGGEIKYNTKLENIISSGGKIVEIQTSSGMVDCNALILATGHSARDIFQMLSKNKVEIEAKSFALGLRIEHPQNIINQIQYKKYHTSANLPPASYSLNTQINGKGVYTFCMCPGGIICPASTDQNEVVVNGWSPSTRNSFFANSGFVVEVNKNEIKNIDAVALELKCMNFQSQIEQKAFKAGGGKFKAPAQRVVDYIKNKSSSSLPISSYKPGITATDLREVLPVEISDRIDLALKEFVKKNPLYGSTDAILVGVESRTSSPVKIPRNELGMHPSLFGLFPCGEGAGFAGGIVSAAIDGLKMAEMAVQSLN